jgi:hypothetical protein
MKNVLTALSLFTFLLFACSENEDPAIMDVSIVGIEDVSVKAGGEVTIPINIVFNNEVPGTFTLSFENVPSGLECSFSKSVGQENFESDLAVAVSAEAEAGQYEVTIKGITSDGQVLTAKFTVEAIKDLSVTFSVLNTTAWTVENPGLDPVEGAEITLWNENGEVVATSTSDADGEVEIFNLDADGTYRYLIEKGTLGNLIQQEEKDGATYGYHVLGVFQTMEEIDGSAQPNASIGDVRLSDKNQDGIINSDDKVTFAYLTYVASQSPMSVQVYLAEKNP